MKKILFALAMLVAATTPAMTMATPTAIEARCSVNVERLLQYLATVTDYSYEELVQMYEEGSITWEDRGEVYVVNVGGAELIVLVADLM